MKEKKEKKELCEQRVKGWPNTLEAVRVKKEGEKFVEFTKGELARRAIDEEEVDRK